MSSLLILCAKKMADHQNVYPIKPELQTRESFCRLRSRDSHCNHLVHLEHKTMKKHLQIRTLMIHKGENMETTLFRLEKGKLNSFDYV
uniref:Uncharacterized protein n=2 Tax=Octopus bimaculoides TaxID=37653 RepID=A0A0L8FNI4_OCTBM